MSEEPGFAVLLGKRRVVDCKADVGNGLL